MEAILPLSDADAKNWSGRTALIIAAGGRSSGSVDCVKALLPLSDAKAADNEGETALMAAERSGVVANVKALLPRSDADAQNKMGLSALMLAAAGGAESVQALLPQSDPWAICASSGQTALDWAIGLSFDSPNKWANADILGASMSPQMAQKVVEQAPAGVELPCCRALLEGQEIQKAIQDGAKASTTAGAAAEAAPGAERARALARRL